MSEKQKAAASATAKRCRDLKLGLFSPAQRSVSGKAGGTVSGQQKKESGFAAAMGREQGAKNAATGFINSIKTPESLSAGGIAGGAAHIRSGHILRLAHDYYHVTLGKISKKPCIYCRAEQSSTSNAAQG